jgi:CBS domain-containing protein
MKVKDIMKKKGYSPLYTIEAGTKAIDAVAIMDEHKIGALIVVDEDDNVAGLVSERDFLYKVYKNAGSEQVRELKVYQLMTKVGDLYVAQIDDKPLDVMNLMLKKKIRHVPVMENGKIVGMVSIGDVLNYLMEQYEEEAFRLREHIQNPMGIHVYGGDEK